MEGYLQSLDLITPTTNPSMKRSAARAQRPCRRLDEFLAPAGTDFLSAASTSWKIMMKTRDERAGDDRQKAAARFCVRCRGSLSCTKPDGRQTRAASCTALIPVHNEPEPLSCTSSISGC